MDGASEPRQRWRLTVAREPVGPDGVGRAALEAWQSSFESSGLPVARQDGAGRRARFAVAAPLPAAARGEAELVDVWLDERIARWELRERLEPRLPPGHAWVDAEDIWLGAAPLPGQVAAADWRLQLESPTGPVEEAAVATAVRRLLDARELPRTRTKGGVERPFDLRPLVIDATAAGDAAIALRTRIDPELGSGRPEDVVAALSELAGIALAVRSLVRVRLLLAGDADLA